MRIKGLYLPLALLSLDTNIQEAYLLLQNTLLKTSEEKFERCGGLQCN